MKPKPKKPGLADIGQSKRHKWMIYSPNGSKVCTVCNSRIQNKPGFPRYYEFMNGYVNWYPRCIEKSPLPLPPAGHGKPKTRKK